MAASQSPRASADRAVQKVQLVDISFASLTPSSSNSASSSLLCASAALAASIRVLAESSGGAWAPTRSGKEAASISQASQNWRTKRNSALVFR